MEVMLLMVVLFIVPNQRANPPARNDPQRPDAHSLSSLTAAVMDDPVAAVPTDIPKSNPWRPYQWR